MIGDTARPCRQRRRVPDASWLKLGGPAVPAGLTGMPSRKDDAVGLFLRAPRAVVRGGLWMPAGPEAVGRGGVWLGAGPEAVSSGGHLRLDSPVSA